MKLALELSQREATIAVHNVAAVGRTTEVSEQHQQVADADQPVIVEVTEAFVNLLEGQALLQDLGTLPVGRTGLHVDRQADLTVRRELGDEHVTGSVRECSGLEVREDEHRTAIDVVCDDGPTIALEVGEVEADGVDVRIDVLSADGQPAVIGEQRVDRQQRRVVVHGEGTSQRVLVERRGGVDGGVRAISLDCPGFSVFLWVLRLCQKIGITGEFQA